MTPASHPDPFRRILRILVRLGLVAWAGFWGWFVLAVSLGEPPPPPPWIPGAWILSLAALVALAWCVPRVGGWVLLAAAAVAAWLFPDRGAWALLAAPAAGLGLACLALGGVRRSATPAALLVLAALVLPGCLVPQDPADLPYRTSSILRHENGSLKRAYLVEETELEGRPCQRWVWWYDDGSLDNFELARDLEVQGHAFPAGTRLFLDREGRLAHAWLSRETVVDGLPCRGRWKIDTAFHPNGRVKAFFPPDTIEIDGIACAASVFHPVYLHPDGHLRECKLAADATVDGRTWAKGETIVLPAR